MSQSVSLSFIHSFQSERLKTKRSLATWFVIIGGFFTPVIITIVRLAQHEILPGLYAADDFWEHLWKNSWESMALFLLPLGVILATSLITQIEYKNNTWKQLHTLPLSYSVIFFSKFAVIVLMMIQFFVLFNIGIYLSALIPFLVIKELPYPKEPIPYLLFLKENLFYFINCLPIVALQYLVSLKYKNFLVPLGIGFLLWIGSLSSLSWQYGYVVPYTYCMYDYLLGAAKGAVVLPNVDVHLWAIGYFILITLISYVLYLTSKEKG